jgi:hypothetical protein
MFGIQGMRTNFSLPYSRQLILGEVLEDWMTAHPDQLDRVAGLLAALNVKYVLGWNSDPVHGLPLATREGNVTAWRNPAFLPRAFLVGEAQPAQPLDPAGRDKALAYVRRSLASLGDPDRFLDDASVVEVYLRAPVDVSKVAVIESPDIPQLTGLGDRHHVRAIETQPGRLAYDVESDRPALLYISAVHGPGWTATVGGKSAKLYRANWIGTAVEVPAGRTRVDLGYRLPGLGIGAAVSITTTAALGLVLVAGHLRRRR